ncbi:hypothetical protein EHYA_08784 [Embleya hyalina]|uniref:Uncharacterized protein n=1 Tax=Embleya hyalina TaxID=516124 RepID=A0A401Z2C2_9ACTN|nr:hypothetical protein EHYA_08784 [Embleya hyalina]
MTSPAHVRVAAETVGVSEHTVWRRLGRGTPAGPCRYTGTSAFHAGRRSPDVSVGCGSEHEGVAPQDACRSRQGHRRRSSSSTRVVSQATFCRAVVCTRRAPGVDAPPRRCGRSTRTHGRRPRGRVRVRRSRARQDGRRRPVAAPAAQTLPVHPAHVAAEPAPPQPRAALLTAFGVSAPSPREPDGRHRRRARRRAEGTGRPGRRRRSARRRPRAGLPGLLADAPPPIPARCRAGRASRAPPARAPALVSRVPTRKYTPLRRLPSPVRTPPVPPSAGCRDRRGPAPRRPGARAGEVPYPGEDHLSRLRHPRPRPGHRGGGPSVGRRWGPRPGSVPRIVAAAVGRRRPGGPGRGVRSRSGAHRHRRRAPVSHRECGCPGPHRTRKALTRSGSTYHSFGIDPPCDSSPISVGGTAGTSGWARVHGSVRTAREMAGRSWSRLVSVPRIIRRRCGMDRVQPTRPRVKKSRLRGSSSGDTPAAARILSW